MVARWRNRRPPHPVSVVVDMASCLSGHFSRASSAQEARVGPVVRSHQHIKLTVFWARNYTTAAELTATADSSCSRSWSSSSNISSQYRGVLRTSGFTRSHNKKNSNNTPIMQYPMHGEQTTTATAVADNPYLLLSTSKKTTVVLRVQKTRPSALSASPKLPRQL